jgi:Transglycosylase
MSPTIGCIYDANSRPLIELAREYRRITKYEDLPSIIRDAILATEDKNFFSHSGVDYSTIPSVLSKVRIGALVSHLTRSAGQEEVNSGRHLPARRIDHHAAVGAWSFSSKADAQENSKPLFVSRTVLFHFY